jgi:hypothetical protein
MHRLLRPSEESPEVIANAHSSVGGDNVAQLHVGDQGQCKEGDWQEESQVPSIHKHLTPLLSGAPPLAIKRKQRRNRRVH